MTTDEETYWRSKADLFHHLAERCEREEGADIEREIALALHSPPRGPVVGDPYTRSMDAALRLFLHVPERVPSNPRLAAAEGLRQRAKAAELK
jgi:AcrR family transcriptional regulator